MRLIDADALIDEAMERYCEDCDRRKGIKKGKWKIVYDVGEAPCRACSVDDMKSEIEDAPTIDALPVVHGHWVKTEWMEYDGHFECIHYADEGLKCSVCKNAFRAALLLVRNSYCPNCGAKMDEEASE